MNRRKQSFLFLGLGVVLSIILCGIGCSLTQPSPVKQSFLLEPIRAGAARVSSAPVQLRIRDIQVTAPFDGKGFVYRTSEFGYKADFHHEFLTSPRSMFASQLQAWLSASHIFRAVFPPGSAIDATHTLDGNVTVLFGDFRDLSAPRAVVAAEFFVSKDGGTITEVVFHKSYREEVLISERQPEALTKGWTSALKKMFAALEQDLSAKFIE